MKHSILITLYYSLGSIIGLILSVIGSAMLIHLLLTTYILQIPKYPSMPPTPYLSSPLENSGFTKEKLADLSEEDRQSLEAWKQSYAQWEEEQRYFNTGEADKKQQLATAISMILVGIPVWAFHQKALRNKLV